MDKNQAYSLLRDVIFKGFLAYHVKINNISFVFKSLNQEEYDLALYYAKNTKREFDFDLSIYLIILGIFMVDNINFLVEREKNVHLLYKMFLGWPRNVLEKMREILMEIDRDFFSLAKFVDGFSYTDESKYLWDTLKDAPNKDNYTGIPGTSMIGLNVYQQRWMYLNKMMDKEEAYGQDFSSAIMITSASNPKGAKKMQASYDAQIREIEKKRNDLARIGFREEISRVKNKWTAPVETREELLEELERQMSGKKDKHDLFMEKYYKRKKEQAERIAKAAKEKSERFKDLPIGELIRGRQRPLTDKEAQELTSRPKQFIANVKGEDCVAVEDKDRFLKKVSSRVIEVKG